MLAAVIGMLSVLLLLGGETSLELCVVLHSSEELENFIDEDDWHREGKHSDPFVLVHHVDGEDLVEEGHVDDDGVEDERVEDGGDQPWVHERCHDKDRVVLTDGVERVKHLDNDQNGQAECGGLNLTIGEVAAGVLLEVHALNEVVDLEVSPLGALGPVAKLLEGDKGVTITSLSVAVPPHKDSNGCKTDVHTNDHVAEEDPVGDEVVIALSGRLLHNVTVGWVEGECGSRGSISDQVDPEELN